MNLHPTPNELQEAQDDYVTNHVRDRSYDDGPRLPVDTPAHWKVRALGAIDYAIMCATDELQRPDLGFTVKGAIADGRITTTQIKNRIQRSLQ
jgi:hypothetical protein